jgi:Ser/Thr protein kinase RdoA (MazF antagonist)
MRPGCDRSLVELQIAALQHAVAADSTLPLPIVMPALQGERCIEAEAPGSVARLAWLITALPGRLYAEVAPQPPALAAAAGTALGRLARSLRDYTHPGLVRTSRRFRRGRAAV